MTLALSYKRAIAYGHSSLAMFFFSLAIPFGVYRWAQTNAQTPRCGRDNRPAVVELFWFGCVPNGKNKQTIRGRRVMVVCRFHVLITRIITYHIRTHTFTAVTRNRLVVYIVEAILTMWRCYPITHHSRDMTASMIESEWTGHFNKTLTPNC